MNPEDSSRYESEFRYYAGMCRAAEALRKVMPTGPEFISGVKSLGSALDLLERLRKAAKRFQDVEAREILADASERILEGKQDLLEKEREILDKDKKIFALEKQIANLRGDKPEVRDGAYWVDGKGPFCIPCYDSENGKTIRVYYERDTLSNTFVAKCSSCGKEFPAD